jgi:predicted Zn-dependent peptidase
MSFTVEKETLDNGLRVVTVHTPHLHSAVVAAYVRTGSRHEQPDASGVSHFLEHMFFRGSEGYPDTVQMNAAVEEVGGNLNGVTTRDHGYYYTPVHPEQVGVGVRILGDMLTRPRLVDMEVEREVILEEMLDEMDEDGRDVDLDNLSKMELFKDHPLSLKIAGTQDSVKALRHEQLVEHFHRHYVAGNMVMAIAGPVNAAAARDQVRAAFAGLPKGPESERARAPRKRNGPWFRHVVHHEAQTEFRLNFLSVPEDHPDFPALQIIRRVLDDGLSSRLPYNVVERRGLAYAIHAGMETFEDLGIFEVEGASAPEKAPEVLKEIVRTLAEICEKNVTDAELLRAKKRHRMFLDFAHDSPGELAGWFGGTELFRPAETFEARAAMIDAQTAAKVRSVAQRYFRKENLGVVAVGPSRAVAALERAVMECELR